MRRISAALPLGRLPGYAVELDDALRFEPRVRFRGGVIERLLKCPAIALNTLNAAAITGQTEGEAGEAPHRDTLSLHHGPTVGDQFLIGKVVTKHVGTHARIG